MDTQIGYGQLRYAEWTVSYSNQIPSGYAQNRIWADSLNEASVFCRYRGNRLKAPPAGRELMCIFNKKLRPIGTITVSIRTNTIPIITSKTITNFVMVSIVFFSRAVIGYIYVSNIF